MAWPAQPSTKGVKGKKEPCARYHSFASPFERAIKDIHFNPLTPPSTLPIPLLPGGSPLYYTTTGYVPHYLLALIRKSYTLAHLAHLMQNIEGLRSVTVKHLLPLSDWGGQGCFVLLKGLLKPLRG